MNDLLLNQLFKLITIIVISFHHQLNHYPDTTVTTMGETPTELYCCERVVVATSTNIKVFKVLLFKLNEIYCTKA